jgi:hypothetical protein
MAVEPAGAEALKPDDTEAKRGIRMTLSCGCIHHRLYLD